MLFEKIKIIIPLFDLKKGDAIEHVKHSLVYHYLKAGHITISIHNMAPFSMYEHNRVLTLHSLIHSFRNNCTLKFHF